MMIYASPLLIAGLAGITNETIDRILLQGSGFMIYPILLYFEQFINKKNLK